MRGLCSLLLFFSFSFCHAQEPEIVVLGLGQSKSIHVTANQKIHISNGQVVAIKDAGHTLELTGKKLGYTSIRSGDRLWELTVIKVDSLKAFEALHLALTKMRGLSLAMQSDGQVRLVGRLLRLSDWLTLSQIQHINYRFAASLEPEVESDMRSEIKKNLRAAKLPGLNLQFKPEATAFITSEQTGLQSSYEKALKPFGFKVEINPALVSLEPLVRVKILVTEINKTMERQFGVKWPTSTSAQLLPSFIPPGAANPLELQIDAWENSGLAKVLASPNILCRSGKEAEFLAGGEIPIKVSNFASHDVLWKEYGVLLKIQPVADSTGRMSIGLETEVSMLDRSNMIDGVPGLHTNRIQSHFDLNHSRTIALSGLIKNEWNKSSEGLPELSRLPILGSLFSSKNYKNNQTELVVFVTPEVLNEDEDGAGT